MNLAPKCICADFEKVINSVTKIVWANTQIKGDQNHQKVIGSVISNVE